MNRTTSKQVAPIKVYNPSEKDSDENTWGQCKCCGEDCQSHGMCLACVQQNCDSDFDVACSRTGAVDPLDLIPPELDNPDPPAVEDIARKPMGGLLNLN